MFTLHTYTLLRTVPQKETTTTTTIASDDIVPPSIIYIYIYIIYTLYIPYIIHYIYIIANLLLHNTAQHNTTQHNTTPFIYMLYHVSFRFVSSEWSVSVRETERDMRVHTYIYI